MFLFTFTERSKNNSLENAVDVVEELLRVSIKSATSANKKSMEHVKPTSSDDDGTDSSFEAKCKEYPTVKAKAFFEEGWRVQVHPEATLYTEGIIV